MSSKPEIKITRRNSDGEITGLQITESLSVEDFQKHYPEVYARWKENPNVLPTTV